MILAMSLFHLFIVSLILLLIFQIPRIIYRLWLHPLAEFPGPKLAAATSLYAAYYSLVKGGAYTEKLPELHRKYGKTPNEPDFCYYLLMFRRPNSENLPQ